VSPFCLGLVCSPVVVRTAFEQGINFFFLTADMHWPLYEPVREGLRELLRRSPHIREQLVVAVVCYQTQPDFSSMPFEEVLGATPELERLDVLIAGGVYAREFKERLPVYVKHRKERFLGARAIGASFHDRKAARNVIRQGVIDIAFIRYNTGHPGARKDLFPYIKRPRQTLLYNFKSTESRLLPAQMEALGLKAENYWHPAVTDYYRFALTRGEVDGLLIAPRTVAELARLGAALEKGPLDSEQERYLLHLGLLSRGKARLVLNK
jgi:hypothetical protein